MLGILGLHDRQRHVRQVCEEIVGATGLLAGGHLSADDNLAIREGILAEHLRLLVPAGAFNRRGDELELGVSSFMWTKA